MFGDAVPAIAGGERLRRGRARRRVHPDGDGAGHRRPLLQGQRATAARTRARCGARAGSSCATVTFTGETATGWQTATFSTPVRGDAGHDLRRLLPGAAGSLLGHGHGFFANRTVGPADRPAGGNGRYLYGAAAGSRRTPGSRRTTSSTSCSRRHRRARRRSPAQAPPPGATGVSPTAPPSAATLSGTAVGHAGPGAGRSAAARSPGTSAYDAADAHGADVHAQRRRCRRAADGLGRRRVAGRAPRSARHVDASPRRGRAGRRLAVGRHRRADLPAVERHRPGPGRDARSPRASHGTVTAIRFYKGAANTGDAHRSACGARRTTGSRTAPSTAESGAGWQTVTLPRRSRSSPGRPTPRTTRPPALRGDVERASLRSGPAGRCPRSRPAGVRVRHGLPVGQLDGDLLRRRRVRPAG